MFMLFGTQEITNVMFTQQYFCVECRMLELHEFKQVRNFFTIFRVPIVPLARVMCYSECLECQDVQELSFDMLELSDQSLFLPRYWYAPLSLLLLFPLLMSFVGYDLLSGVTYSGYIFHYVKWALIIIVLNMICKVIGI